MNDRQFDKLDMYHSVLVTCGKHSATYGKSPAFARGVGKLQGLVDKIEVAMPQQSAAPVKGATAEKRDVGAELVQACLTVSDPMNAMAFATGNQTLWQITNINKSTLLKQHKEEMLAICKTIAGKAAENAEQLADCGIDAEDLDALNHAIAAYKPRVSGPRAAIIDREQQTDHLVLFFAEADSLLIDQLDKLIRPFKTKAADFWTDYKNARHIISRSNRRRNDKDDDKGDESPDKEGAE